MVHISTDGGLDPVWWYCILLHLQFQGTVGASDEVIYVDVIFHLFLLLATLFWNHFLWFKARKVLQRHRQILESRLRWIVNLRHVHQARDSFPVIILLRYDHLTEHLSVFRPNTDSTRPIHKTRITLCQILYDISLSIALFSLHSMYRF